MAPVVTRGTILLDEAACKGCELCIAACPPQVLSMSARRNDAGHLLPQLHAGCTGCQACQLVCPDFCIAVFRYDTPRTDQGATP